MHAPTPALLLQAELAAAQAQRDDAAQRLEQAEQQRSSLQEQLAAAEASLADTRQQAEEALQQHREAAASAAELRKQLADFEQQAAAAAAEKQEWGKERGELQDRLAELKKAQSIAEGKLLLARQRDTQFKVRGARGGCRMGMARGPLACMEPSRKRVASLVLAQCACRATLVLPAGTPLPTSPDVLMLTAGGVQAAEGAAAGAGQLCRRGGHPPTAARGGGATVRAGASCAAALCGCSWHL